MKKWGWFDQQFPNQEKVSQFTRVLLQAVGDKKVEDGTKYLSQASKQ